MSLFTCEYEVNTHFLMKYVKGFMSLLHEMCQCTYSAPPASQDPSGIHHLLGRCQSGPGQDLQVESCPCRSSEGARDLFYKKAEIAEGLAGKWFWPAVTLSRTVGALQLPKWQYSFPPWKTLYSPHVVPYVLHIEGEKYSVDSCKSSSVHHKRGECTL